MEVNGVDQIRPTLQRQTPNNLIVDSSRTSGMTDDRSTQCDYTRRHFVLTGRSVEVDKGSCSQRQHRGPAGQQQRTTVDDRPTLDTTIDAQQFSTSGARYGALSGKLRSPSSAFGRENKFYQTYGLLGSKLPEQLREYPNDWMD